MAMINLVRLFAVARKEAIQLRRDAKSLAMAFVLPVFLLIMFGYAITWDINDIATAVLNYDNSARSRELLEAFRSSGYFTIRERLTDATTIGSFLERNRVEIVLVVPPDFASNLDAGRPTQIQAIVDGSDANTATIIIGYARAIVEMYSTRVRLTGVPMTPPLVVQSRVWYNEDLKSRNMIVPGLIAVIMMIIAAMLTSLTIAREWERGTMEQLAATPVARVEVVLGKLLPYVAIGLIDVVVCAACGLLLFGVPLRGSPFLLLGLSFFFLVGALGLGMFISALAKSQLLATQISMIVTFLPAYLLSGFMFSIDVMPKALRAITYVVPARYFLVVTRGIFLKGVGVHVLFIQGFLMIAFAVIGLSLATRVFKKELR